MQVHFQPAPLSFPQSEVLAALVRDPSHTAATVARELALPESWISQVLSADLFRAHVRAARHRQASASASAIR